MISSLVVVLGIICFLGSSQVIAITDVYVKHLVGRGVNDVSDGDNGPATSASLSLGFNNLCIPWVDRIGNIYIPDYEGYKIRKINLNGIITKFGETGVRVFSGASGTFKLQV
jgi:hypothetical protein